MKKKDYTLRIAFQLFLAIVGFFILMKLFGLEKVTELRFFNILIVAFFTNRLARLNSIESEKPVGYLEGLRSLFFANAIAVVLSVVGFVIYASWIDPGFIDNFKAGLLIRENISLGEATAALFMEGMASAAIASFAIMQYWKDVRRTSRTIDIHKI